MHSKAFARHLPMEGASQELPGWPGQLRSASAACVWCSPETSSTSTIACPTSSASKTSGAKV